MSDRDVAVHKARQLRTALLDHGVRKVSIEVQPGRPGTPNERWHDDRFIAEMSHHTVSRPSQGNTPVLALVKNGRSDVPGPLANGYMGYDLVYRVICMGWANHPGAGGPLTVAGYRIPQDVARPYAWGTEYEGGIESWSDAMHEAMARANAGILDWLDRPLAAHIEHLTWAPRRKIDRLGYTAASGQARIRPYVGGGAAPTTPEDDVSEQDVIEALRSEQGKAAIWTAVHGGEVGQSGKTAGHALEKMLTPATQLLAGTIGRQKLENGQPLTVAIVLQRVYNLAMAAAGDLDEQRIAELTADITADLLVERMSELPAGADKATMKAAVREVLQEGVA